MAKRKSVSDQPTCDLLTQRMHVHEKTAWMLRSLLE
jgi:starvation-inducible DNA-binding protein